jgi:sulfur relay (sulfurtransferase) complex TusBCD TusD component (DsrE family)
MQKILIIINDAPYGTEKAYNALRMAMTLQKEHGESIEVKIFLLADAVFCGLPGQSHPECAHQRFAPAHFVDDISFFAHSQVPSP